MNYRDWYVGMKVVCVKSLRHPLYHGPLLEVGRIYTVSWIGIPSDGVNIDLAELPSPQDEYFERGWVADHFRPVQPRKTDISIFTAMLTGAKQQEPA